MVKNKVVVRRARLEDAAALARTFTDAFGPTTASEVRKWLERKFPRDEAWVAVMDGEVAATATLRHQELSVDDVRIKTGGILAVATRWDFRRRGLATRLMRKLGERARSAGMSNTTLFTGHQLAAIRIYRRLGYSEGSDWRQYAKLRDPLEYIRWQMGRRSKWLPMTDFGRDILNAWDDKVLIDSPGCRVTISFEDGKFKVLAGRRGRPTIVVKGDVLRVIECFWNRIVYDDYVRRGIIRLTGSSESLERWRRVVTLEWVE